MTIRAATRADYGAYARLVPELGTSDPVPSPALFEHDIVERMLVWVDAQDDVRGFVTTRRYGALLHVVSLVVDAPARGHGVGRALLMQVREDARAAGCTRWYLNVKRENAPALHLYGSLGLVVDRESWALVLPWDAADALPQPALVVDDTGDDAAFADALGLDASRIAAMRTARDVVVLALRHGGQAAALAAFDPTVPVARMFAVRPPALAGALLAACRPHARHPFVRLFVEGDRALTDHLLAAGATVQMEILRLSGVI